MAPRLADYIKKQIDSGYDVNTVRNFLIRNGYDSREIDEAVDYIYKKPKRELPLKTIGIVVIAAIVVLLFLMLVIRGCGKEEEVVVTTVIPEVIEPEIEEEFVEEIVPEVIEEEIPELGECPASCDDFDDCTIDYCGVETGFTCVNERIIPCCGNGICEAGEDSDSCSSDCEEIEIFIVPTDATVGGVIYKARELAKTNPGKAGSYCSDQDIENFKDSCYKAVAETAKSSTFCDKIISELKRNSCYATAATEWNDFSVCEKITDKYLSLACTNMAETI